MKEIKLSIVIPCYNEEKNIPLVLEEFKKTLDQTELKENIELILVDNNSKDNSSEVLKKILLKKEYFFARTVFQKNPGYGAAILKGLEQAKGKYLCWTHADMQTPPFDCIRAYNELLSSENIDRTVIKGKRIKRKLGDTLFTFGMSLIASIVLRTFLFDINAQPKLFSRTLFNSLKNPPLDFSLDLYLLYLAKKRNYKIKSIKVFFGKRMHGQSAWAFSFGSKVKTIIRTIKYIFALKKSIDLK